MEHDPVKREHPRPKSGFQRIIKKTLKLRRTLHFVQFWNPGNPVKSLIELHKRQEVSNKLKNYLNVSGLWHMCKIYISVGILSKSVLSAIRPQMSAFDNCTRLYWAVLSCTGLCWTVLNCTGLCWIVLGCTGL